MNPSVINAKDDLKKLPVVGEPVWVQCDGFRCLAYLDKKGCWKTFYDRKVLFGQIKVLANQWN